MISSSKLFSEMKQLLDAEKTDFYDRIIPVAINNSVRWCVSLINTGLGQKKFGEEVFESIQKMRVFRTSQYSRISLSSFPGNVWTITAVVPKPTTASTGDTVPAMPNPLTSYYRPDLVYVDAPFPAADRLNQEQFLSSGVDPFSPGYNHSCNALKAYCYMNPVDYRPSGSVDISREIEIKPALNKEIVAIAYVESPAEITEIGDNDINLPQQVFQLLQTKALQFVSWDQGDQTNLFGVTEKDVNLLAATFGS